METNSVLTPLFFVVICLMAGALLKFGLKRTALPYTVGLFAFGILAGALDRLGVLAPIPILKASVDFAGNANPNMILYIFLPILIFDAAYELDIHVFRKTLLNSSLLAVPGVVVVMFLTAALLMGIGHVTSSYGEWTWTFALMFGGLISATDPVAVVALLKELGTSKRFSTLVDAESMLNDGTGIVLFMLFFGSYASETIKESPVVDFILVVAGGVLTGLLVALACIWFITKVQGDEMLQNSVMILGAYLTFIVAEDFLDVSGVIALVAFGLTVTYVGRPKLKPQVNRFMEQFWELTTHLANTLIFIIVGIIIAVKVRFDWKDVAVLFLVYIGLNLIRMLMVALFYPLMKRSGYGLSIREAVILSWGGLRGALGLTLALMVSYTLPIPEPIRRQTLFLTAGIVTLTLTINATTIGWLLKKLGLATIPSAKLLLDYSVRKQIRNRAEAYFDRLRAEADLQDANWKTVREFLPPDEPEPVANVRTQDLVANIRLRVLDKERALYEQLYDDGIISPVSLRRLTLSVDDLYDRDGKEPLSGRKDLFDFCKPPFFLRGAAGRMGWLKKWTDRSCRYQIIDGYDLAHGWMIAQKAALKVVESFEASDTLSPEERNALPTLQTEIRTNMTKADRFTTEVAADYPRSYRAAVTRKSVRMLLSQEKKILSEFRREGLLSEEHAEEMADRLGNRSAEKNGKS